MKPHRLCSRIWGLKLHTRHFSSSSTWGHWLSTLCSILLSPDLQLCESPSLHPSQQGADVYRICGFSCEPDLHLLLSHHFEEFEIPRWEGVDTRFHLGFSSIILHVQTIRLNCISGVDSILPQTLTGYLFLGAAAYIMTVWALQKHKRLRKTFDGKEGWAKYPRRWVIMPPLLWRVSTLSELTPVISFCEPQNTTNLF